MFENRDGVIRLMKSFPKRMTWAEALDYSIEGWEYTYKQVFDGYEVYEKNTETCALCTRLPIRTGLADCGNCPVQRETGVWNCAETPYWNVEYDSQETIKSQLDFLKSLRK